MKTSCCSCRWATSPATGVTSCSAKATRTRRSPRCLTATTFRSRSTGELNSGLDDALQTFSAQLSGVSGWPLNAFVTPEGYPVFVVLYAPPDDFRKQLNHLTQRWVADRAGIRAMARQVARHPPGNPLARR
ncbi:MAG: DUF255 domain-containing protein [Thiobacillus sp.]